MRTSKLLFLISAILANSLLVAGSAVRVSNDVESSRRRVSDTPHVPKPKPKKPSTGADASAGDSTSSSGGDDSSGSSGSSGGDASVTSATGTSGSDGSAGVGGGVGTNGAHLGPAGGQAGRKGAIMILGAAAVCGAAIATVFGSRRRVETPAHPLKGSLNRRINLFSHLASDPAATRRGADGSYVNADEAIV